MRQREVALLIAERHLGTFYTWGGDDPSSFDCSGLMIEALKSSGVFPRKGDDTADGLRGRYEAVPSGERKAGDLVFWLNASGKAFHVGMVWGDPAEWYIGAEGGGSSTKTIEDAIARNAFVKLRPIASRGVPETRCYARPYPA